MLGHGVPPQSPAPGSIADRQLLTQVHAPDDSQKSHLDHSVAPAIAALGEGSHGSILGGNYAPTRLSSGWKSTVSAKNARRTTEIA